MTEYQREQVPIPTPGRLARELRLRRPPVWMVLLLVAVVVATWLPLYWIYRRRHSYMELPKIHYVHDMDLQPGFRPQEPSELFSDGRAARRPVPGTIARGHLRTDDHFYRGYRTVQAGDSETIQFFDSFPASLVVDDAFVARGRQRYDIYCAICHDPSGTGNGLVHQRAVALKEARWVPPTNLLTREIRDRADGQIFQAISDGARNMPSYKTQISARDRWAIVAYVRHLQATQPVAVAATNKASP